MRMNDNEFQFIFLDDNASTNWESTEALIREFDYLWNRDETAYVDNWNYSIKILVVWVDRMMVIFGNINLVIDEWVEIAFSMWIRPISFHQFFEFESDFIFEYHNFNCTWMIGMKYNIKKCG